ncbi:MAG: hypothetical protein Q7T07_20505 [Burkholderiaceae bacterium]|nr:hypothetical protein [Burkholderiaceae bacterium]
MVDITGGLGLGPDHRLAATTGNLAVGIIDPAVVGSIKAAIGAKPVQN